MVMQEASTRPRVRIEIDLNARDENGLVPAYLEDADGYVAVGDVVTAFESEDEVAAPAKVVKVEHGHAFLDVDWNAMTDDEYVPVPKVVVQGSMLRTPQSTASGASWVRIKIRAAAPILATAAAVTGFIAGSTTTTSATPAAAMRQSTPVTEAGDTA